MGGIPMGLQPAASYFQYGMLMIVLAGLAYVICEGYIDDIILHGQDDSDLLVAKGLPNNIHIMQILTKVIFEKSCT